MVQAMTRADEEMEIIKSNDARSKPRYKNIIHLWEFLLELLANENFCAIISWSRRDQNEFKLKKPKEVARRWGILRRKKGMTYEKLSRALRFYYGQGIIQKVPGQTFTYKFDKLPYKYEPGVTRSLYHEHKMTTGLHERDGITPNKTTSPQTKTSLSSASGQTSFLPTGTPRENSWSLIPKSAPPIRDYSLPATQFPPQKCHVVNLSTMALPNFVSTPVLNPSLYNATTRSIPVSVIKRVQTDPNENCQHLTVSTPL